MDIVQASVYWDLETASGNGDTVHAQYLGRTTEHVPVSHPCILPYAGGNQMGYRWTACSVPAVRQETR